MSNFSLTYHSIKSNNILIFFVATYRTHTDNKACCLSGGKTHRLCRFKNGAPDCDLAKQFCDKDIGCKGYFFINHPYDNVCHASTTSSCPSGSSTYGSPTGDIDPNYSCFCNPSILQFCSPCYIKGR